MLVIIFSLPNCLLLNIRNFKYNSKRGLIGSETEYSSVQALMDTGSNFVIPGE